MTIIYHNKKIYTLEKDDALFICNDYIECVTKKYAEMCKTIGNPINVKLNLEI